MFDVGFGEIVFLLILALLVLGPEKLPKFAADAGRFVRNVRQMAAQARTEVRDSLGAEFNHLVEMDPKDLNPRTLVQRHLLDDDEDAKRHRPGRDSGAHSSVAGNGARRAADEDGGARRAASEDGGARRAAYQNRDASRPPYDSDAT